MLKELSLDGTWWFTSFTPGEGERQKVYGRNYPLKGWLKGSVPGTVQGDLLRLGKTPDPFFDRNADEYRFVEKKEWWYAKHFVLPASLKGRTLVLRFEGLDTIATIYLNGDMIGTTQNMFTPYEFEVGNLLRGKNRLAVKFDSPIRVARERDKRGIIRRDKREDWFTGCYIRKANIQYGTDMHQRMVTVGIWRPVRLLAYREARIRNAQVITRVMDKKADVRLRIEVEQFVPIPDPLSVTVEVKNKKQSVAETKVFSLPSRPAQKTIPLSLSIPNPQLWWPNGMGEQNLYSLKIKLLGRGRVLDRYEDRFGIREVRLLQRPDRKEGGRTFGFTINGAKVFAKGGGWAPADSLIWPVPAERYRSLVGMAKKANFNMLRPNGFGIYEDDEFYRACDEEGIMVWQDFMFSLCPYPDNDQEFVEECRREGEVIVKRLRNHPSIVLWCGNNEVQDAYGQAGPNDPVWKIWGKRIFHETLPAVCKRLDPSRPYWPGTAWSSPGVYSRSPNEGDIHFYPWSMQEAHIEGQYARHVPLPFTADSISYRRYAQVRAKFFSEFGQRGIPAVSTLRRVMGEEDIWPPNEESWAYHSTPVHWGKDALKKMALVISEFTDPEHIRDIEEYVFYSQLAQARHLQFGIEEFRRRKFSCGGAVFWSFNDSWPCSTYSVVDYYLRRKMAYYWVRRAFDPILVAFNENGGRLELWVVNDLLREVKGRCVLSRETFLGDTMWKEEREVRIRPNSSRKLRDMSLARQKISDGSKEFFRAVLEVEGHLKGASFFMVPPREIALPSCELSTSIKRGKRSEDEILISTDSYARLVEIQPDEKLNPEDNFFDLPPGGSRKIALHPEERVKSLHVNVTAVNAGDSSRAKG